MDLKEAILFGQLVNAAYAVPPNDLANRAGKIVSAGLDAGKTDYAVITSIYANDLATDLNPARGNSRVSMGLVLQAATGDAVIAIRGTEGIQEWVHDATFLARPCPFLASAGNTEDGFTQMYSSLTTSPAVGAASVASALAALPWSKPVSSLTICGHSLGGALATLLALDAAANTPFKRPTSYTYASPRTGDPVFANTYNHAVPNTYRIANRVDLVPTLPWPPLYEHVVGISELSSIQLLPPKLLVKPDPLCSHILHTYLHLLSRAAGGTLLPLDAGCIP